MNKPSIKIYSSIKYTGTIIFFVMLVSSCIKDKGNYDYNEINMVSVGMGFTGNLGVNVGDTLKLTPVLRYSLDTSDHSAGQDSIRYTFGWFLKTGDIIDPKPLSVTRQLSYPVKLAPGAYEIVCRVKDSETGVTFQNKGTITVTTPIYEGYLVLNDVNGVSRLDMLSYKNLAFSQYTDVLTRTASSLPPQAKPYQVYYFPFPTYQGIWLLTESGTSRLDPETFNYQPSNDIRYSVLGTIPPGFKAMSMLARTNLNKSQAIINAADGDVYLYNRIYGLFSAVPFNRYDPGIKFTASRYYAYGTSSSDIVGVYDETNKQFALHQGGASFCTPVPDLLKYPKGRDLIYMEGDKNFVNYAILRKPSDNSFSIYRFTVTTTGLLAPDSFSVPLPAAIDFDKAEKFAFSPVNGYLFYNVGGKLYEYDLFDKKSILMLDLGSKKITHLSFNIFHNAFTVPISSSRQLYQTWANWLNVGSYDPAGDAATSGMLSIYSVPDVHQPLVKQNEWTGFGKIVSLTYRER